MNLLKIDHFDDKNGNGARMTIFVAGCPHKCKGCFNVVSWSYLTGYECTQDVLTCLFDKFEKDRQFLTGLSILGGEPLAPRNYEGVLDICLQFKKRFPEKDIWVWTGYTLEELKEQPQAIALSLIDTLVDGRFEESLKDTELAFRGSSNQRILKLGIDY
ncbi:anaerobic ribonucleoside-triphosphate reductase activating protein [Vibrio coralliirubri]|uniref:anaerobic ribonucleoside-triphosphate reductase activating protein n=1 Tax=Vibrio coralliirubri TaxID=1516159 RepID=UPI002283D140|nr:anaerobic ribonucleoside-triphosphate reductase activating protein [Vibrio coralliirubri]MCY9861237.1 anaerobic ribonucleoside-triphosphate reductase activating protein [Vibrio coralliirubri]